MTEIHDLCSLVKIMKDRGGNIADRFMTYIVDCSDMLQDSLDQVGSAAAEEDDLARDDGLMTQFEIRNLYEVETSLMQRLLFDLQDMNYKAQWEPADLLLVLSRFRAGGLSAGEEGLLQHLIEILPAEILRRDEDRKAPGLDVGGLALS
jgi:hypothetical protein